MNIDPSTTKYLIKARLQADGIVEKPDVVGAIFGQTEGLLGDELDLHDLQKSGRMGRIEVEVISKQGKSDGEVLIPSSLDQVETVILASALETIDRVGPCKAKITILGIEDVRVIKRAKIIERAKELLAELIKQSKTTGIDLTESVRQSVQLEELVHYGKEHLPAGPNVTDSDAVIVVEGRNDVLNLLRSGIKNTIAVEGTNVPKTVMDLSRERIITAFVDGDRGGDLILRELFQVAEVDFVARAPRGMEVEELTQKQIMKCLRNKIPGEQYMEMYNMVPDAAPALIKEEEVVAIVEKPEQHIVVEKPEAAPERPEKRQREPRESRAHREPRERKKKEKEPVVEAVEEPAVDPFAEIDEEKEAASGLSEAQLKYKEMINSLATTSKANILGADGEVIREVSVRELVNTLKGGVDGVGSVVFDGIITQRIVDIAAGMGIATIVGTKLGNIAKQPENVEIWTKDELNA
ncbi:DNA primase DnaG [Candidatus Methanomassiliicoccus intestinalis]|uniref:DNA primase DnaG n=1 Tax=Candidatus Methanomassiliicoccus intestinalis TaxID=1406512 RepID=UPI0037DD7752